MFLNEYSHQHGHIRFGFWDRIKILFGAKILVRACNKVQISRNGPDMPKYDDIKLHSYETAVIVYFGDKKKLKSHKAQMRTTRPTVIKTVDVQELLSNNKDLHKE